MAFIPSGPSYIKSTSPLGGCTYSSSGPYVRHTSPFFGRSYSSPCSTSYGSSFFYRPWFNRYIPPVVVYDNSPRVITPHSNIFLDSLLVTIGVVITVAIVNSALMRSQICTMGRDCNDVLNEATGHWQTICSDLYERCV